MQHLLELSQQFQMAIYFPHYPFPLVLPFQQLGCAYFCPSIFQRWLSHKLTRKCLVNLKPWDSQLLVQLGHSIFQVYIFKQTQYVQVCINVFLYQRQVDNTPNRNYDIWSLLWLQKLCLCICAHPAILPWFVCFRYSLMALAVDRYAIS